MHNNNLNGIHADTTIANFLFGPRLTLDHPSRFRPFFQVLWGGVYGTSSAEFLGNPVNADTRLGKQISFRPIALDYYLTRLQNLRTQGDNNQNNLRYSAGFTESIEE